MYKKLIIAGLLVLIGASSVVAQTAATQTYLSDSRIEPGTLVSLQPGESERVEVANQENQDRLFGVVVRQTDSTIRLREQENGLFVTTLGKARAYVTDFNGPVRSGDTLTISPIAGVAMKSTGDAAVIGVALNDYDAAANTLATKEIEGSEGGTQNANIGAINIQVNPEQGGLSIIPSFLASFGESVAGQPVSSFRLFTALAVMVVTLAASSVLLFGAIRSAIVAIGRNPLSKSFVYKGLFQVLAIVAVIFIGGVVGAFVILRV